MAVRTVAHKFEFTLVMVVLVVARELYVDVGCRVFSVQIRISKWG
jgi:hypothetical protein